MSSDGIHDGRLGGQAAPGQPSGGSFDDFDGHQQQQQQQQAHRRPRDDYSDDDSIIRELRDAPISTGIVTDAPAPRFRLNTVDVVCLVLNRMIGSGIFMTPQKVMSGTHSTGVSLLFWFAGVLYALAGMHVYIEFGLNVPRVVWPAVGGVEQSVPRSGGDLNYLQYVYRWVGYRGQTVLYITCLFGVAFVAFGNMAGNCINFAVWTTRAAGHQASEGAIRGIALALATFSCFIHAFSRRGGILLNDVLAIIKVLMLLLIIVTAVIVAADGERVLGTADVFADNVQTGTAFGHASRDAHSYASAFLSIIFAFSGFEQPNYVLGEIGRPRQRFPRGIIIGTVTTCLLYMFTNISYMVVVPECAQTSLAADQSVADAFFKMAYSNYSVSAAVNNTCTLVPPRAGVATAGAADQGSRIFAAFFAISALGNVIVMTYTAARVKQEIAKNGILPCSRFFAHNSDVSVGRLLKWLQRRGWFTSPARFRWLRPEEHMEKTPVGALVLHEASCVILILVTLRLQATDAYSVLASLAAYTLYCFFGALLGLGILILRLAGPPPTSADTRGKTWRDMTGPRISPALSVVCATTYLVGNAWPVVDMWVPSASSGGGGGGGVSWFVVPTVSWCVLGVGSAWFLGFLAYAKRKERRFAKVFTVDRAMDFERVEEEDGEGGGAKGEGGLVMVHETVYLAWQAMENMKEEEEDSGRDGVAMR